MPQQTVPHIESLRVKNYRALHNIELKQLKPLSVFLGANGSGKSTLAIQSGVCMRRRGILGVTWLGQ